MRLSHLLIVLFGVFATQISAAQLACSRVLIPAVGGMRALSEIHELKIMTFNAENLITVQDYHGREVPQHDQGFKDEAELHKMRIIIDEAQPDFLVLQEVGSLESLRELTKAPPLKGKYEAYLKEGNDHFHIGFLVKTDMKFKYYIESHANEKYFDAIEGREIKVFSRDLPALMVMKEGTDKPAMILFGNHAKSKRDRDGDPESRILRTKQYEVAAQIIKQYQDKYGPEVPMLFAGDFNTDVQFAPEVAPLKKVLESSFNVAKDADLPKDRITHTYHPSDEPTRYSQIDDVMITPNLKPFVIEAHVIPYKDENGRPKPPANTWDERRTQPSDHRPVLIKISTEGFNTSWVALHFDVVA